MACSPLNDLIFDWVWPEIIEAWSGASRVTISAALTNLLR